MKARLSLFAHASICAVFLAASTAAGADETRVKVAVTQTSSQAIGTAEVQHRPPGELQVAQRQSGRDDCLTRPQAECGPGLTDCLSRGQSDCKNLPPAANRPDPNTAAIDKLLQNPNLSPAQRDTLLKTKSELEANSRRAPSQLGYFQCLQGVTNQCRATNC
jgi:hypothetical protein